MVDVSESEIVLEARRSEDDSHSDNVEEYACLSEWMFYQAVNWHFNMKSVGNFVATEDSKVDLFSLKVRRSTSAPTNSWVVTISQKGNKIGSFYKACQIFGFKPGVSKIWDLSGHITKLFQQRSTLMELFEGNDEIFLELHVYGLSFDIMRRENEMEAIWNCFLKMNGYSNEVNSENEMEAIWNCFLKMNGHSNEVNSYVRHDHQPVTNNCSETYKLALTGLENLGNTCYMNSAVQCLVHTPQLVDYFLEDFRKDPNLGTNGNLAPAFGDLIKHLCAPGPTAGGAQAFKSRLSGVTSNFSDNNQHDAHEFLEFLLNELHEDLNQAEIKPYNGIKDVDGISNNEVADLQWHKHNDSIIVGLYQGQERSTLTCPLCKKDSVKFDRFLFLPLPLPSTKMKTMEDLTNMRTLTILVTGVSTLPSKVSVIVPKNGKFKDLIQALSTACSLGDHETLLVAEVYQNCILHFLDKPADSIDVVKNNDKLVAYRLLKDEDSLPLVSFRHYLCHGGRLLPYRKFGFPLATRIHDCSDGSEIHKKFLQVLRPFLMGETEKDYKVDVMAVNDVSNIEMNGKIVSKSDVNGNFEFYMEQRRLFSESDKIVMDKPLLIPESRKLSVCVLWPAEMLRRYDVSILCDLPETGGSPLLANKPLPATGGFPLHANEPLESVSLYKCLEAYLKEESLGPQNMWKCSNCNKRCQATKKLDMWRLPKVLIIQLKRFSSGFPNDKLETFVDFPIDDFDLSNYTVHKDSQPSFRYKLYAVSNHYGGIGGGHYTAFAQCGEQWYEFNDSNVSLISEDQIKTPAAYVLFYKRI